MKVRSLSLYYYGSVLFTFKFWFADAHFDIKVHMTSKQHSKEWFSVICAMEELEMHRCFCVRVQNIFNLLFHNGD